MFHGQVETPAKGVWSFLDHPDNFVLVAINTHSLHIIDYYRNVRKLQNIFSRVLVPPAYSSKF